MDITSENLQFGWDVLESSTLQSYDKPLSDVISNLTANHDEVKDLDLITTMEMQKSSLDEFPHAVAGGMSSNKKNNLLMYYLRSICKLSRQDAVLNSRIDEATKEITRSEGQIINRSTLNGMAVLALANYLIAKIPVLAGVGPFVIAAILIIILTLGMDALCDWLADNWAK